MKKAIIVGASSGIGKEMAKQLSEKGYQLGLMARRIDLLNSLKTYCDLIKISFIKYPRKLVNIV